MQKTSRASRLLAMYEDLKMGKAINKAGAAGQYGIDQRSVQRDIDDIRDFLRDQDIKDGGSREVVYSRQRKGFVLKGDSSPLMTNGEILAASKILLESRAFTKQEMSDILDKLVSGCVPQESTKLVSDLLSNEKFHYVELGNPMENQDCLWDIGCTIQSRELLKIIYQRQDTSQPPVQRVVEPLSILFSDYYFYLNAFIVEPNEKGVYEHKYDYPATFRMDRIADYQALGVKFRLPYASRFQEGEFRKRVQFMYPGILQKIRFLYTGNSVEAILDRLPTATVLSRDETGAVIEAEVYGKGILMWLLSQGEGVEVLAPQSLRSELRDTLKAMLSRYQD